jgi:putative transposase
MKNSSLPEVLHPGHHSIRLKNFDYTQPGFYFVTICSHERRCLFGSIQNAAVSLNALGRIVQDSWAQIPKHFPSTTLHNFVVMPNHVHGIIEIGCQSGRSSAAPLQREATLHVSAGSLAAIVRSFKSAVTKNAHERLQLSGQVWQRSYFETVVRGEEQLGNARSYIARNPSQWQWDRENLANHKR